MLLRFVALVALSAALALPATAQDLLRVTDDAVTDTTRFAIDAGGGMHLVGNAASAAPTVLAGVPQFMWWPGRVAFRAGTTPNPASWSTASMVGVGSFAFGLNANAQGTGSIALGENARATGDYSLALGRNAGSTLEQFAATFNGGYRFRTGSRGVQLLPGGNSWSALSDSTQKENIDPYDAAAVLDGISRLRLGTWNYKGQDPTTMRHWGPMAQDFFREFGRDSYGTVGNDTMITTQDADGVLFAAVQALEARTREQAAHIDRLEARLDALDGGSRAPLASGLPWALAGLLGIGAVIGLARRRQA